MSDRETAERLSTTVEVSPDATDEEGAKRNVSPVASLRPLIKHIREIHRWRVDLVKTEVALHNRANAVCRRLVGFNTNEPDLKKRK